MHPDQILWEAHLLTLSPDFFSFSNFCDFSNFYDSFFFVNVINYDNKNKIQYPTPHTFVSDLNQAFMINKEIKNIL